MKTKILLLLTMFAFTCTAFAQKPWRAKLFVHFIDSNNKIVTDTIWFGLDSLGDDGLQTGLDVFDTTGNVNKILSHDSLIQNQFNTDCGNLKHNIKKIKYGITQFDFYAIGRIMSMSWDTADFLFDDNLNKCFLSYAKLTPQNGYIGNIDGKYLALLSRFKDKNYIYRDSVYAINESPLFYCNRPYSVFAFSLVVTFVNELWNVGIKQTTENIFIIRPNPFKDNISIDFKNNAHNLNVTVRNLTGKLIKETNLNSNNLSANFDLADLDEGIYIMSIEDNETHNVSHHKIIKSNF